MPIEALFQVGWKNESLFKVSRSHYQDGTPFPYMVKHEHFFFSGTRRPMTIKVCMRHRVLKYYQVYSNNDPGLTLTYFTARSNLVPYAFV